MSIAELLDSADTMRGSRRRQASLPSSILGAFHAEATRAYAQAGLDPKAEADRRLNAGCREDDFRFQVELSMLPNSELLGSRYLVRVDGNSCVEEVDLFVNQGELEGSLGRLRTARGRLVEYGVTSERLQQVTRFMLDATEAGMFRAVPDVVILPIQR